MHTALLVANSEAGKKSQEPSFHGWISDCDSSPAQDSVSQISVVAK